MPNTVYQSNGVPFGGFAVAISRPATALTPGTSPANLGTYIVESLTPTYNGILGKRPAADGGDNGWWLVDGTIEGSAVIQLATGTTPTLQNGDFFTITTDVNSQNIENSAAGAQVSRRFVIHSPGLTVGTGDYRKQSVSVIVDRFES